MRRIVSKFPLIEKGLIFLSLTANQRLNKILKDDDSKENNRLLDHAVVPSLLTSFKIEGSKLFICVNNGNT
jgi:hypothetical protein